MTMDRTGLVAFGTDPASDNVFCQIRDGLGDLTQQVKLSEHNTTLADMATAADAWSDWASVPWFSRAMDIFVFGTNPLRVQRRYLTGQPQDDPITLPAPGQYHVDAWTQQIRWQNGTAGSNAVFTIVAWD